MSSVGMLSWGAVSALSVSTSSLQRSSSFSPPQSSLMVPVMQFSLRDSHTLGLYRYECTALSTAI